MRYTDPTGHWQDGDENLPPSTQLQIIDLTEKWVSTDDQAERDLIHQEAEQLRNGGGTSTGDSGSSGSSSSGSGSSGGSSSSGGGYESRPTFEQQLAAKLNRLAQVAGQEFAAKVSASIMAKWSNDVLKPNPNLKLNFGETYASNDPLSPFEQIYADQVKRFNSLIVTYKDLWHQYTNYGAYEAANQVAKFATQLREKAQKNGINPEDLIQANDIAFRPKAQVDWAQLWEDASNATVSNPYTFELYGLIKLSDSSTDFIRYVSKLFGKEVDNIAEIWKLDPKQRGKVFEKLASGTDYRGWYHVGEEYRGFYPVIDFQHDMKVASFKTMDPTLYSGNGATQKALNYLRDLRNQKIFINTDQVYNSNKILDIVVPKGTSHLIDLDRLRDASRGVQIQIREY